MSSRAVARAFNSCHSTILCLWTLFQPTGDLSGCPKTGRRESRPPAQDCVINLSKSISEIDHQTYKYRTYHGKCRNCEPIFKTRNQTLTLPFFSTILKPLPGARFFGVQYIFRWKSKYLLTYNASIISIHADPLSNAILSPS